MTEMLPHINASLNGLATVLLILGFILIKRQQVTAHKWVMLSCFLVSSLFLACYLTYHYTAGHRTFSESAPAAVRTVYFVILITHIVLAVTDLTQGREILARATLVPRLREPQGVISLDVARIVPRAADERLWLFGALRWSDFADRVKEFANGSTVLHLSPDHVAAGLLLWPPDGLRSAFVRDLEPILAMVDELHDSSDRLAAMRDLLLPKLMTGQIDVSRLDLGELAEVASA